MKPRPRLQDMPDLVKCRITDNLKLYIDKMSLRAACPNFYHIIGNPEFDCGKLVLIFDSQGIIVLKFEGNPEDHVRIYCYEENGCQFSIVHGTRNHLEFGTDGEVLVEEKSYLDLAVEDFEMLMDNPNLKVGTFEVFLRPLECMIANLFFSDNIRFIMRIGSILRKTKLKVTNFSMSYNGDQVQLLQVLRPLNPGTLKSVSLTKLDSPYKRDRFDKIRELKKWKKILNLKMIGFDSVPVEVWWNVRKIEIENDNVSLDDLKRLLEHFHEIRKFGVSFCKIRTNFEASQMTEALQSREFKLKRHDRITRTKLLRWSEMIGLYIRDGFVEFIRLPNWTVMGDRSWSSQDFWVSVPVGGIRLRGRFLQGRR